MPPPPPAVLVFDVNETLVDIEHLTPLFTRVFGDGRRMREWFAQLVLYSTSLTLAGRYAPFSQLGAGALRMLGEVHGASVTSADIEELGERMRGMPAHPDAALALQRLRDAGFRLVTLTNSAPDPAGGPLQRSGLDALFEAAFSVHSVKRFKPAPECYRHVAEALGVDPAAMCMVAAHSWDTLGAQALGCRGALVTRPGNATLPAECVPASDVSAADLGGLAAAIIQRWG